MAKGSQDSSSFSRCFSYSLEKTSSLSSFSQCPSSLSLYTSSQTPVFSPSTPSCSSSSSTSSRGRCALSLLPSESFCFFVSLVRTISRSKKSRFRIHRRPFLSHVCNLLAVVATMWACRYTSPSYSLPVSSFSSTPFASAARSSFSNSREFSSSSSSLRSLVLSVLAERKKRVLSLPRRSLSFIAGSPGGISPSRFSSYSQDFCASSCPSSFLLLTSTHLTDYDRQCKTSFFLSSSPSSSLPSCSSSSLLSSLSSSYSSPRRASASTTTDSQNFSSVRTASSHQQLHGVKDTFSLDSHFSCPGKRPLAYPPFASSHAFSSSSSSLHSQRIAGREKEEQCQRRLLSTIRDGAVLGASTLGKKEEGRGLQGRTGTTCEDEKTGGKLGEKPFGEALRKKDALWGCYLEGEEADKELKKLLRDSPYSRVIQGVEGEKNFQVLVGDATREKSSKSLLSPWHDVPLIAHQERRRKKEEEEKRGEEREGREEETLFNAVIEIPKNTRKKMEIQTHLELNPIMQDVKPDGNFFSLSLSLESIYSDDRSFSVVGLLNKLHVFFIVHPSFHPSYHGIPCLRCMYTPYRYPGPLIFWRSTLLLLSHPRPLFLPPLAPPKCPFCLSLSLLVYVHVYLSSHRIVSSAMRSLLS